MKFPLTVCVFLLTVSRSLSVDITVTGTEGRRVSIKCPYDKGYKEYYKYFYKNRVLILQSDGIKNVVTSGRFSLKDDRKSSFTVTISHLRMEDAGPYGCRAGSENYKHVQLKVIRAPETTTSVQISTSTIHPFTNTSTAPETTTSVQISTSTIHPFTNTSSDHISTETTRPVQISTSTIHPFTNTSTDLASVSGGLGSALLVLALCSGVFLIRKKRRKRKCGTALFQQNVQLNTETDHVYEEIPNSDVTVVTSSSNQMPPSSANQMPPHPNTHPKVSNIKSPEATQDSGTELIYIKATHPQNITTDKGPIYSVINH